ncbi:MAG: hypothetical protein MK110_18520 [Fuerstiella sp.]|nr:hypothetical protein [Fuerstiella sp.]
MKTTGKCIGIYLLAMFTIAFLMPIVSPTDVPPPGADPLPAREVAGQILAIYGVPLVIVLFYLKRTRSKRTES